LSFLAPVWTINGFDSAVHISEEAANARTAVPFAIIASTLVAGVLGWGLNMAFAFNMGNDMNSLLSNPIGQPLATIFFNSLGKPGTLALWSFLVTTQFMMGSSTLLATSRQVFAFARDGALPFSSALHRVDPHTHTPVNAVWASVFGSFLIGLLTFAGAATINAIFAMSVGAQYLAYGVPIACFALAKGTDRARLGPFTLGRLSIPIAVVAVIWMVFASIIVFFPSVPAPTPNEMNYAAVVFGGVLGLAILYYFFPRYGGMYWFQGPVGALRALENDKRETRASFSDKDSTRKDTSNIEKFEEERDE